MTRSGTTAILYVNASVISSETFDADMTANGDDVWIGESENGSNDYNGKFALPRIYKNRALSHLEIQNHFNREKHLFGVW